MVGPILNRNWVVFSYRSTLDEAMEKWTKTGGNDSLYQFCQGEVKIL